MNFQVPATTTSGTTGFSFNLPTTAVTNVTTSTTTAAVKPAFSFGAIGGGDAGNIAPPAVTTAITTTAPVLVPAQTTSVTSTAPAASFSFGTPVATPATKTTTLPTLGAATTTTTAVVPTSGGFANLSTATKTTDSAAVANATHFSYNQLEEHINKWTLELEDQEKVFTDQAIQTNAWDKILIANNQKILELNDAVLKIKADQQNLEQELEFIATQHKDLEESIAPLQKEFTQIPQVDVERSQTYLMVENLDTQLKQMSEDLKEIIDSLNESNKHQDSSDPIIQIGKILNAHMSSLQWIESSSASINNKLNEITKMHDNFKRDSERSFRSAYYN